MFPLFPIAVHGHVWLINVCLDLWSCASHPAVGDFTSGPAAACRPAEGKSDISSAACISKTQGKTDRRRAALSFFRRKVAGVTVTTCSLRETASKAAKMLQSASCLQHCSQLFYLFDVWFHFSVCHVSRLLTWRGGLHRLYCSQPSEGSIAALASITS